MNFFHRTNWKYIAIVVGLGLVVSGGIVWYVQNVAKRQIEQDQPREPSSQVSIGHDEVLYAYQVVGLQEAKTFKADIKGKQIEEVGIGYTPSTQFLVSPNGEYFARWNGKKLEIGSSKNLSFKTVFEASNPDEGIKSVVWFPDSSKVAFIVSQLGEYKEDFTPLSSIENRITIMRPFKEHRLYVVARESVLVQLVGAYTEPQYAFPILQAVSADVQELYWFDHDRNFAIVNMGNGKIKKIVKEIEGFERILIDTKLGKAYYGKVDYAKGTRKIIEYAIATGDKKELFETQQGKYLASESMLLKGNTLIFAEYDGNTSKIYKLSLSDGQSSVLLDDPLYYHYFPKSISPDGAYLWLEALRSKFPDEPNYYGNKDYVMDIKTKGITPFPKEKLSGRERIEFLGWIRKDGEGNIDKIDTSTWQTYRNEKMGFEFKHPEDWPVQEIEPGILQVGAGRVIYVRINSFDPSIQGISFCEAVLIGDERPPALNEMPRCERFKIEGISTNAVIDWGVTGESGMANALFDHLSVTLTSSGKIEAPNKEFFRNFLSTFRFIEEKPVIPTDKESCETKGGTWGRFGLAQVELCNLPTSDEGKSCTDSSQCEGACITDDQTLFDVGTTGYCYGWTETLGTCLNYVNNGRAGGTLCAD